MGRSTAEILRAIDSLQLTRKYQDKVSTPADWELDQAILVESQDMLDINEFFTSGVMTEKLPSGKGSISTAILKKTSGSKKNEQKFLVSDGSLDSVFNRLIP